MRAIKLVAGVALAALVVLGAMAECGVLRRPAHEEEAPARRSSDQPARSPTVQAPVARARPALPRENPGEPSSVDRPSLDSITGEAQRRRTHVKVNRYVHEAYPAWRRAHPDQECPRRLSELDEYIQESDANDGWGRPLTMYCGLARLQGGRTIEVISLGRDAELQTDDDILAAE